MSRFHIRIVAILFAIAVLSATVVGAMWMWKEQFKPEQERKAALDTLMKDPPKVDTGLKVFDQALSLIRERELTAAHSRLEEILNIHRSSARLDDARRVLGEINMDGLYSRKPMPGKLEYTVGRTRQDNLNSIASRFRSTVPFIKRVNNLLGPVIHPGDRLVLYPLDFEVEVNVFTNVLTVLRDGRFFKSYTITGQNLASPSLPQATTIATTGGWIDGKAVRPDDEKFSLSRKYLQTASRSSGQGVFFTLAPPSGEKPEKIQKGIYLSREDLEELTTILRPGVPLRFSRSA